MHEILFKMDDACRNVLTASFLANSVTMSVFTAIDNAEYDSTINPPYVVCASRQARESEAYGAENYHVLSDVYLVVNPDDLDSNIRSICGTIAATFKTGSAPSDLTNAVNGLHVATVGGEPTLFRREIEDTVWKLVMSADFFAFLT
jgi:hypothetical protein